MPKGERIKPTRSKPKDTPKDAPDSGEATNIEEVVLNLNSKGERWHLDKDRKVVVLSDDALAEKDRQQREPDTPPAPGYPKYARMSGHAEMPAAPGESAPPGVDVGPDVPPAGRQARGPRRRTSPENIAMPVVSVESFVESLPSNFRLALKQLDTLKAAGAKREDRVILASRGQIPTDQFETFKQAVAEYERLQEKGPAPQQSRGGARAQGRQERQPRVANQRQDRPDFRGQNIPQQRQAPQNLQNEPNEATELLGMHVAFGKTYRPGKENFNTTAPAFWAAVRGKPEATVRRFIEHIGRQGDPFPTKAALETIYRDGEQSLQQAPQRGRESGERELTPNERNAVFEEAYYGDRVGLEEARKQATEGLKGSALSKQDELLKKMPGVDRAAFLELQKKDERLYPAQAAAPAAKVEQPKAGVRTVDQIQARIAALKKQADELG